MFSITTIDTLGHKRIHIDYVFFYVSLLCSTVPIVVNKNK